MISTNGRKRAAIYLRVSTADQAERNGEPEGYSIPAQRGYCRGKADLLDAEVVIEYVDAGESAKSADRPQLQAMLERIRTVGDLDYVIVHKINRLARSMRDYVAITDFLDKHKVQFVSVTENIDGSPYGKFMQVILAGMAELESNNLATEVIKGSVQKAKAGGTPTMAPIGYENVKEIVDGRIIRTVEVDRERAALILWVFQQYATDIWAVAALHAAATARGLWQRPTRNRPARPMHMSQFAKMLHNKYYIGIVTYRGVEYEGNHEPIIPRELFERVQRVLAMHDRAGERVRHHHHYLKGSLVCAHCHSRMSVARANGHGGTYDYFFCLNRIRAGCRSRYVAIDRVEDWICRHYETVQLPAEMIERVKAELLAELEDDRKRTEREVKRQQARLTRLENERKKLLEAYYAEAIGLPQFKAEQTRIDGAINRANEIQMVTDYKFKEVQRTVAQAIELAGNWGQAYRDASPSIRRQFNQAFFKAFLIDYGGVTQAVVTDEFGSILTDRLRRRFERQDESIAVRDPEPVGPVDYRRFRVPQRELVLSGVGSSKQSLVDLTGVEPPGRN